MNIPFVDIKAQYQSIRGEISQVVEEVLASGAYAGGPYVAKFEQEFAHYCQTEFAVGVGNGTDALWLALLGLGIGQGDEVITVPNTFIATAEAISICGATPVFVDIDETTFNMDPALIEKVITAKTKAIIPVHLYGQMADMDPIMAIARQHGLYVIEDASQAHGAEYNGRRAGSIGDAGCFSFYPGKNLGACGEAGAIVTNNRALADTMRMLRDHGQEKKYYHSMIGWNARMDGIQGAILSTKLKHLPAWTEARRNNAARYTQALGILERGVKLPSEASYAKHVYHVYAIRCENRDYLLQQLGEKGIHCGIHYPVPLHQQRAYQYLKYTEGAFPITERCAKEILSLPLYPELSSDQIEYVVATLKSLMET